MVTIITTDTPHEGIRMKEEHTLAYVNNVNKGLGILYITENNIVWINECNGEGFTLNYPDISIFAVCSDQEKYSESCVYMLVDDENTSEENGSDSESDNDENKEVEVRFAPLEGTNLRDIFDCIQTCNQLHASANGLNDNDDTTDEEWHDVNDADSATYAFGNRNRLDESDGTDNDMNGQFEDVE